MSKMLFSPLSGGFVPTRANIICFRRSSLSVFLGDRIVCGWVGGHFSSRVAWVSSPPTYLQTINIFDSSEVDVKFSTFCCEEPSMLVVCGWVGGALFMLPAVVFGPPTHLAPLAQAMPTCLRDGGGGRPWRAYVLVRA